MGRSDEEEELQCCQAMIAFSRPRPLWAPSRGDDVGGVAVEDMAGNGQYQQMDFNKSFLDTDTLSSPTYFPHAHGADSLPVPFSPPSDRQSLVDSFISHDSPDLDLNLDLEFEFDLSRNNYNNLHYTDCHTNDNNDDSCSRNSGSCGYGDSSFLIISRRTSAATTTAGSATVDATSSANPPPLSNPQEQQPLPLRRFNMEQLQPSPQNEQQQRQVEEMQEVQSQSMMTRHAPPAELSTVAAAAAPPTSDAEDYHSQLFRDLDRPLLFPEHLQLLDDRPYSSRSHLRYWHHTKSPTPNASKYLRVSSEGPSSALNNLPSMTMTREEFEALPLTIQRKYFSTLERLRFAVDPNPIQHLDPLNAASGYTVNKPHSTNRTLRCRRYHKGRGGSDTNILSARRRPRFNSIDQDFYANLPDKIKRRHLTEEEQLAALCRRKSVILDAADEALIRRQSRAILMETSLARSSLSDRRTPTPSLHSSNMAAQSSSREADTKMDESFQDSFRWLEEDEELDLRLFLDDYHINLRDEVPLPSKSRRPSFRRHLSINKLPFGRPSVSYSRPTTKDTMTSPTTSSPAQSPAPGSSGHVRRKSRALSLISPNRQHAPSTAPSIDPGAAHYQDPEARMKLRVYLASPQKFDEAIEFGFPSMDGVQGHEERTTRRSESRQAAADESDTLRTFLEDDDRSSIYSDDASAADPESPRTPETFVEKPGPMPRPLRVSTDPMLPLKGEYAHAPASSREMTLRMTLTRPDLRADEDQIYGWRGNNDGRRTHHREESAPVQMHGREGSTKDSIERQLAALDQWNDSPNESGVVKRIWNKVRRS